MARITIPYAVADFAEMRERGFYYVDKTNYIPGLEDYNAPIFLRPRRFGKSLLISMLAHYYDRTKANRFEELFGGTWIGEHPTEEHNQYLVIRYDFSAMVMANDMEGVVQNFNDLNCGPVEVTVEHNRDLFGDFQFTTRGNAVQMLEELLGYISSHGLPKAYILIDEYDNFTNQLLTSYNDSLYEEVTTSDSFLLTFFKVIKAGIGEGTIRTCFCTGVLPVIMDDLTSGYNIAEILTFKPVFLNMLGFTYEETKTYLRYVLDKYAPGASEERFEEIWQLIVNNYDGYRFSPVGERLFNSTILTYFFKKFAANAGSITTLKSAYRMVLPNMTMRSIYMDYYNQLNKIEGNASRYVPVYELYDSNRSFEPLVQNYFEQYLGQFPAQVFDKINENFIRCSFYELVSRYLSHCYTFAIEQNNSVGRSDFEMIGIPGTDYYTDDRVVEFKYYRSKDADRMLALTEPLVEHVEQVKGYAADTKRKFPNYHVRSYIVYICANKGWKCWEV